MSVWISMREPLTEIWTSECECDYENRCAVASADDSILNVGRPRLKVLTTTTTGTPVRAERSKNDDGRIIYPFLYGGPAENAVYDFSNELYHKFGFNKKICTRDERKKHEDRSAAAAAAAVERTLTDRFLKLYSTKYKRLRVSDLQLFDVHTTRYVGDQSENRKYSRFEYWRNRTVARFVKYAVRLKTLNVTDPFRPLMYVYDVECKRCVHRQRLTLKFFNLWYNKAVVKKIK